MKSKSRTREDNLLQDFTIFFTPTPMFLHFPLGIPDMVNRSNYEKVEGKPLKFVKNLLEIL